MRYFNSPKHLAILLLFSISAWLYVPFLAFANDLRASDFRLTSEELYWWEFVFVSAGVGSSFYVACCSIIICYTKSSKLLAVAIVFIWQISYIYALYHLYKTYNNG